MPILYMICGGAPPTQDIVRIVPLAQEQGWDAWVVPTPQALTFLDVAGVEARTNHPARSAYRLPGEDRLPPPAAVLAAPLTFSSLNKWAAGIADTFALGALTEALGEGRPVVAIPWAKPALTCHPAFGRSIDLLRSIGAVVLDTKDPTPVVPDAAVSDFPWRKALASLPPANPLSAID
jgi:hypothetical protein